MGPIWTAAANNLAFCWGPHKCNPKFQIFDFKVIRENSEKGVKMRGVCLAITFITITCLFAFLLRAFDQYYIVSATNTCTLNNLGAVHSFSHTIHLKYSGA